MRIEKVHATAFGPFANRTMEFAPGLTLVFGPNESGKSTLHAATYAALCGRRRGKGAGTNADRAFKRQHQPWDGGAWAAGSEITLADGRRVALTHDLLGKVECRAVDAARGKDLSGQIMHDGVPDGAKLLGLNRESFGAVAVVNQAQLLAILNAAGGLQQELQRAAASSAGERPAAGAIRAIDAFHGANVGGKKAPTKPLRRAQAAEQEARKALASAQEAHAEYLRLLEEAHRAQAAADASSRAAREAKAALEQAVQLDAGVKELARLRTNLARAQRDAAAANERYEEARQNAAKAQQLHARFGGVEPQGLGDGEQLAQLVGAALEHWQHAPQIPTLTGPTAADIQGYIDALPEQPDGDLEVHPQVSAAAESLATMRRSARQRVAVSAPAPLTEVEERAQAVGGSGLRGLAYGLQSAPDLAAAQSLEQQEAAQVARARAAVQTAEAAVAERQSAWQSAEASSREAEQAVADARMREAPATSGPNIPLLVLGAALALAGVALLGTQAVLGGAMLLAGAAVAVVGLRTRKSAPTETTEGPVAEAVRTLRSARDHERQEKTALTEAELVLRRAATSLATAETRATHAADARRSAERAWSRLTAECAAAGVPQDAGELRRLAIQVEAWQRQHDEHLRYVQAVERDRDDIEEAERLLDEALSGRGVAATGALDERLADYRRACRDRSEQAAKASQRPALQANLQQRRENEANAERASRARREAFQALVRAAVEIGSIRSGEDTQEADADRLTAALQQWNRQRAADLKQSQQDQRDWASLQALLDGGTLDDVLGRLDALRASVQQLDDAAASAQAAVREAEVGVTELALTAGLAPTEVVAERGGALAAERVAQARSDHSRMAEEADKLRLEAGNAQTRAKVTADSLLSVADAEADLAAAVAELQRVENLDATLHLTLGFLSDAQDRVHADLAPVLSQAIESRLATVTLGRYTRVRIDPETLQVQVAPATGEFQDADRLSFGTTEQIYLLVRIALAEMLGDSDEPCPLLLDDVTVHADGFRTPEILQTLLTLTEERQIILFSQEEDVLAWAEAHLTDASRHTIIRLDPVPAGT